MSLYYGAGAPYTGLCVIEFGIGSLGAIGGIATCLEGSHEYVGYLNATDLAESGTCNWVYQDSSGEVEAICLEVPLKGTIGHEGDTYSIYDETSTLPLTYDTLTYPGLDSRFTEAPVLLVNLFSTEYAYFATDVGYGTQSLTPASGTAPTGPLSSLPPLTMSPAPQASSASTTSSMGPEMMPPVTTSSIETSMISDSSSPPPTTATMPTSPVSQATAPSQATNGSTSLKQVLNSNVLATLWVSMTLLGLFANI